MRRLILTIDEPIEGKVIPQIADPDQPQEAAARYRAIVVTTLRQLRGLQDTRIQIISEPADAAEAIRFWILPRLADQWKSDGGIFRADGWEISFGDDDPYTIEAIGHPLCPFLSARWVHTAMLGLENGNYRSIGHAPNGQTYFTASANNADSKTDRLLPELPILVSKDDWQNALNTPLGPALKKALEKEKTQLHP